VREARRGVPDALDDRHLALVVQRLDAFEVLVQAVVLVDRQSGVRLLAQGRAKVAVLRIADRDQRLQAIIAAAELDHHEDLVVRDSRALRAVQGLREHVRHGRVAGGQTAGAGPEDEPLLKEVPARDLVDADVVHAHLDPLLARSHGFAV